MQLIKNKFLLSLFIVALSVGVFGVGANYAQAVGAAYFPQNTNVTFSVDNFTIVAGSDADAVTTTGTSITITISYGQSFTFRSTGRKELSVNGNNYTSKTCSTSESKVVITPSAGDPQRIVIITPTSGTCVDTSGTGGGGGGGGGGTTTTSTATPTPTTSPAVSVSPASSPTTTPAPTYTPVPVSLPGASSAKLYRKVGDSKIYVVQANGLLKWVKSLDDFNLAGYRWQNVKVIPNKEFSKLKIDVGSNAPVLATSTPLPVFSHLKIKSGIKFVNIRSVGSLKGKIVARALSGQEFEFSDFQNGWYSIKKDGKDLGWISGGYVSKF